MDWLGCESPEHQIVDLKEALASNNRYSTNFCGMKLTISVGKCLCCSTPENARFVKGNYAMFNRQNYMLPRAVRRRSSRQSCSFL